MLLFQKASNESEVNILKQHLETQKTCSKELQQQLKSVSEIASCMESTIQESDFKIEHLQKNITAKEAELNSLNMLLQEDKMNVLKLENSLKDESNKLAQLTEKNNMLETQNQHNSEIIVSLNNEIKQLKDQSDPQLKEAYDALFHDFHK